MCKKSEDEDSLDLDPEDDDPVLEGDHDEALDDVEIELVR